MAATCKFKLQVAAIFAIIAIIKLYTIFWEKTGSPWQASLLEAKVLTVCVFVKSIRMQSCYFLPLGS